MCLIRPGGGCVQAVTSGLLKWQPGHILHLAQSGTRHCNTSTAASYIICGASETGRLSLQCHGPDCARWKACPGCHFRRPDVTDGLDMPSTWHNQAHDTTVPALLAHMPVQTCSPSIRQLTVQPRVCRQGSFLKSGLAAGGGVPDRAPVGCSLAAASRTFPQPALCC